MTQIGEGIAVTTLTDPEKPHWVQVEYTYANGKPVKGSFLATDSKGMTWTGRLNDKGQACLSNLPPGSVEFELVAEDMQAELKKTRAQIKAVLDAIIAEQKAEAAKHEKELARQNALQQAGSHYWAYTKGFWNGAVGLVTFAKDVVVTAAEVAQYLNPLERVNNALHAAYKSYHAGEMTSAQWKQSFAKNLKDEEIKDIAKLLGIDAKHLSAEGLQNLKAIIAEAYEITAFIADDKESLDLLMQFGKDYAGAQSSIEWAEFAGGGVFEIILTALLLMFTGGVGNIAQGASKIRHAGKLKSLGSIFRNLGKLLKRKKLRKRVRVNVDTKKTVKTELPKDKKVSTKPIKKMEEHKPKCFQPGDALKEKFKDDPKGMEKEFYKQLKAQQDGINKMTVGEYTQNRQTLQNLTDQYGHKQAREILTNGGKAQEEARKKLTTKIKKSIKNSLQKKNIFGEEAEKIAAEQTKRQMEQLAALHDPDLIAGGNDTITRVANKNVNSSLGSQWAKDGRVDEMDAAAKKAMSESGSDTKMNVTLERCKH